MKTYREYSFQDHKEVYKIIDSIVKEFGYDYYLIGANARDIQLYKAGLKPTRGTADIDFAVMIPSYKHYDEFIITVIANGFKKTKEKYRVIYSKSNTVVDILPYGKLAEEYTLNFDEREIELSILGFEEVGKVKEEFSIDASFTIPTSPAYGLIILKLIAWNERKARNKDLTDIRSLFEAGWELYQGELYNENSPYFDLLDEEEFDVQYTAARIMGRKIKPLLDNCKPLKETIISLLKNEVDSPSLMTVEMSKGSETARVIMLLTFLLKGILDD